MPTTDRVIDPGALSEEERSALRKQLRQVLSDVAEGEDVGPLTLQVEGEDGWAISLPGAAAGLLLDLLSDLAEGRAVSVADVDEELTTRTVVTSAPLLDNRLQRNMDGDLHRVDKVRLRLGLLERAVPEIAVVEVHLPVAISTGWA